MGCGRPGFRVQVRAGRGRLGGEQVRGRNVVDGGLEVLVFKRRVGVDGDGPHRLVADSGGQGVGVAGVRGAVGPGLPGYGVEGELTGADFEDAGVRLGVEVGCGRFDGDHLAVVVGGEQNQVVAGVAAVVVHGGERDVAVVVKQDAGDAVSLVLDTVGGLVEEVEGELEFVVHDVFSVRVLGGAPVSAGGAANRLRVGGQ